MSLKLTLPLAILVSQTAPQRLLHGPADEVFGRDELQAASLSIVLETDQTAKLRIGLGQGGAAAATANAVDARLLLRVGYFGEGGGYSKSSLVSSSSAGAVILTKERWR